MNSIHQNGDIVHVHTSSLLGEIIRLFERMRYGKYSWSNHTALIAIEDEVPYLYEANPKVMRTPFAKWVEAANASGKQYRISRIPNKYWKEKFTQSDIKKDVDVLLGDNYSYKDLMLIMPVEMCTGNYFEYKGNDKKFICSLLITFIIRKYTTLFNQDNISPAAVYQICDSL